MSAPRTTKLNVGQRLLLLLISLYRVLLSPFLGGKCRFYPSCSEYGRLAIIQCGFFRGISLTSRRILRCHPWHPGGIDFPPGVKQNDHKECDHGR